MPLAQNVERIDADPRVSPEADFDLFFASQREMQR
jgi:hypothetical protein